MASDLEPRRFRALGISSEAEAAYIALLAGEELTSDTLAKELVDAGLAHPSGSGWVPASAEGAVGAWASLRAAEESAARVAAGELRARYEAYLSRSAPPAVVRVLRGSEEVLGAARELSAQAERQIDELTRGPFVSGPDVTIQDGQPSALSRGVQYRVAYASSLLTDPRLLNLAHESMAMGEQARAIGDIPLRVMIVDESRALVVLPHPSNDPGGMIASDADGLLVERSPMLDALIRQFREIWDRATPLTGESPAGEDGERRRLLTLLALGMTDAAIARTMGVSERTVHRRVAALAADFGVAGRFQLGVEAERRGLLSEESR